LLTIKKRLSQKHQNFVVLDSKMLIYTSKLRFFHLREPHFGTF
jgi:hypothetical protein